MILLVDDNSLITELIRELCANMGRTLDVANTGEMALRMAARVLYDLVFMDLNLPGGMCGVETAIQIRQLPPPHNETPIIALTGLIAIPGVSKWDEAKFVDSLVKPFSVHTFEQMIRRHAPSP